jgi:hypothetical protein
MSKELVKMAGSNEKHELYYAEAFKQLESGKGNKWNWSAAIFNFYWMLYHKIYKEAFIFLGCFIPICAGFMPFVPKRFYLDLVNTTYEKADLYFLTFCVVLCLVCFFICGLWGNRLLFGSLTRKHKMGYRANKKFEPIDTRFPCVAATYIFAVFTQLGLFIAYHKFSASVSLSHLCASFVVVLTFAAVFFLRSALIAINDLRGAKK